MNNNLRCISGLVKRVKDLQKNPIEKQQIELLKAIIKESEKAIKKIDGDINSPSFKISTFGLKRIFEHVYLKENKIEEIIPKKGFLSFLKKKKRGSKFPM